MSVNIAVVFACALIVQNINCARILGVVPTPSYSHQVAFRPLWRELSLRGHAVTTITTDPMNDTSLTNLTEISWNGAYHIMNEKYNITDLLFESRSRYLNFLTFITQMRKVGEDILELELENEHVQKLINDQNERFDLVIIEIHQPIMFAFGHRFKCPAIGVSSLDASLMGYQITGNPTHPVLYPDFMLPFEKDLSFIDLSLEPYGDTNIRKYFGEGYPSTSKIVNIDMMFVNVNPAFYVRPILPNVINIGGGTHLDKPKPLPKEVAEFLDNAENGFVYLSFGTNMKSRDIPASLRQVIMDALGEIPYKTLWKFEATELPGKPDNVKIMKWLPQQDILMHPKIKLFITQGGLQSMEEAIFAHVPLVMVPFMGDQDNNARRIVANGFGESIDHRTITKDLFKETILKVIDNPRYRNRAKEIAKLASDQPMSGLEKAVWWTEYVIRHKGAKHLKSPALDMPLYQFLCLDVIGFILIVVVGLIYIVYKMAKFIFSYLFRSFMKKKLKLN